MQVKTMDDINVGDRETSTRTITAADTVLYAGLIGDRGPLHLDEAFASKTPFGGRVSYGMLGAGYLGATLAQLLGVGSAYVSQSLRFRAPILVGETITVETIVTGKDVERSRVFVDTTITRADGVVAVKGEADLIIFDVEASELPSSQRRDAGD